MKLHSLAYLILFLFLSYSCTYKHDQDYYIQNDLNISIQVHFDLKGVKTDSIVTVPAQTNKLIYTFGYPFGSAEIIDEREDDAISNIKVQTTDTLLKLDESYWMWEKESKYHGVSTIKVDTSLVH